MIELCRVPMARNDRFQPHSHVTHQLGWAATGVLRAEVGRRAWILPPTQAIWIPAGVEHDIVASRPCDYFSLYVEPGDLTPWKEPTVMSVSGLARELIAMLTSCNHPTQRVWAEQLLLSQLSPSSLRPFELPWPRDDRAVRVAERIRCEPLNPSTLGEWGRAVGASGKTLARLFVAETGLTFSEWRTRARLHAAMPAIAAGEPVARIARSVGYSTASAFIAVFRNQFGTTPTAYFTSPG